MRHMLLFLFAILFPLSTGAHELRPAVADIRFSSGTFEIDLRVTLEALIAEVDPNVTNTDEAETAQHYDALRALPELELAEEFVKFQEKFLNGVSVHVDGTRAPINVLKVQIPAVGDIDLIRDSLVIVTGTMPSGANEMTIGWSEAFGAVIVRVTTPEGEEGYSAYLTSGTISEPFSVAGITSQSGFSVFANYISIGYVHILPKGLDHILFVVGLFLLSAQLRPLLWQITAFTVAHTITLALGMFGLVVIPPAIVEPLIAASIVYVAVENVLMKGLSPWRPFIVFGFGLLHGLGFAGVLAEVGIARAQFVTGLIGFNVGVELGQLTVIAVCFIAIGFWFRNKTWYRSAITIPLSLIVAAIGAYWLIERTLMAV